MVSLRTICAKTVQWGILGRMGGFTAQTRRAFLCQQSRQWQSYEQIRQNQLDKLRLLLRHAIAKVPYYRRLHASGNLPDDIKDGSEMKSVPVLTKTIIQQEPEAFLAENVDRGQLVPRRSGGSTGCVLEFFASPAAMAKSVGAELWGDSLAGYHLGDPVVSLWGARLDFHPHKTLRDRVSDYLTNRRMFMSFNMNQQTLHEIHRQLQAFSPTVLVGYAGALREFAGFLVQSGLKHPGFPRRGVVASAETLAPSAQRAMAEAFGRPVYNRYGTREAGLIAMECDRHEGLHVNYEDLWVDLDQTPDAPSGLAAVIVTKLNELAMPLIRYAMDDFATDGLQNCSCGRGYPTIARVHGKTLSVIRCTDGTAIAAQAFVLLLDYQPVRKYQVVQEADYSINLRLVPGDGYDDTVEAKILSLIRHVVGDLPVRIQRCSDIPMTPSGKLLPVISHVTVGESKGKPS